MFDFDTVIERQGSFCEKYDALEHKFGRSDVIPLWVADMDFAAPPCVLQALEARLTHGVFGYSFADKDVYESLYDWFLSRHQWKITPSHTQLAAGVVPSLFAAVQALTEKGDGIIVPTPVYPPFFSAVKNAGRKLIESPLLFESGHYHLDFKQLEKQAQTAKMLLLCNPHNPVGRVWQKSELERLIEIALKYQLIIVSDDIHCDLTYPDVQYTPLATMAPKELRLITAVSPSKSFNIPGLNLSAFVCSHLADKQAINAEFERVHVNPFNPLSLAAFKAAYSQGGPWLDSLRQYLNKNRHLVLDFLQTTPIHCASPEASCLMWLDCKALALSDVQLKQFFIDAGLGLNDGLSFGAAGSGFMRLNIGTQKARLEQALAQLGQALERHGARA